MDAANYQYYAIKPLAKTLLSSNEIVMRHYVSGKGWQGTSLKNITTVQIDNLADIFLQALDQVKIDPVPFNEDEKIADDPINDDLLKISEATKKVITAITNSVVPLFQYLPNAIQTEAAKTALKQQLQQSLHSGWAVKNILVSTITNEVLLYWPGTSLHTSQGEEIDTADIPIVLRSFPDPVMPNEQSAIATYPDSILPNEMQQYTYAAQFSRLPLQGDNLYINLSFEETSQSAELVHTVTNDLLSSLAEFSLVFPAIFSDLQPVTAEASKFTVDQRIALAAFADVVETVATAWENYWNDPIITDTTSQAPANVWVFNEYKNHEGKGLLLSIPPGNTIAYKGWPVLLLNGNNEPLPTTLLSDNECLYNCSLTPGEITTIQIQLSQLNLFSNTEIRLGIATQRNCFNNSTIAVDPAFTLHTTNFILPLETAKPSLQYNNVINVNNINGLKTFFDNLLGTANVLLTINLSYQYDIAPGLPATLPVALLPSAPWNGDTINNILSAATAWFQHQQPAKGIFVLDTTISTEERDIMKISELQFEME